MVKRETTTALQICTFHATAFVLSISLPSHLLSKVFWTFGNHEPVTVTPHPRVQIPSDNQVRRDVPNSSHSSPVIFDAMASYPDLSSCGRYDGKGSASRWILRLRFEFKRAGQRIPDPSEYLETINMQCDGEAATLLDSSPFWGRVSNCPSQNSLPQAPIDQEQARYYHSIHQYSSHG
jgi:hypothetical protein